MVAKPLHMQSKSAVANEVTVAQFINETTHMLLLVQSEPILALVRIQEDPNARANIHRNPIPTPTTTASHAPAIPSTDVRNDPFERAALLVHEH